MYVGLTGQSTETRCKEHAWHVNQLKEAKFSHWQNIAQNWASILRYTVLLKRWATWTNFKRQLKQNYIQNRQETTLKISNTEHVLQCVWTAQCDSALASPNVQSVRKIVHARTHPPPPLWFQVVPHTDCDDGDSQFQTHWPNSAELWNKYLLVKKPTVISTAWIYKYRCWGRGRRKSETRILDNIFFSGLSNDAVSI
jgi:hypothetical protein